MGRRKFTREFKLPPGLSRLQRERMEKKMRKGHAEGGVRRGRQRSPDRWLALGASWEVEPRFTPQKRDGRTLVHRRFLNSEKKN